MTARTRATVAAATIRECRDQLAARGRSIVCEAIGAVAAQPAAWRRYPEGEVYDPASHAQYFYHSHPAAKLPAQRRDEPFHGRAAVPMRRAEHGHFHLFLRAEGMPRGITPLVFPETAVASAATPPQAAPLKRSGSDEIAHLVAISIDEAGEPIRFFTTNRWVTGETWYRGEDVARMIDRFAFAAAAPPLVLNRWLAALLQLYRDDLKQLLEARDEEIIAWRWRHGRHGSVFDDTRLEIASYCDIDLTGRLAEVESLAVEPRLPTHFSGRAALPRMAEGWGD